MFQNVPPLAFDVTPFQHFSSHILIRVHIILIALVACGCQVGPTKQAATSPSAADLHDAAVQSLLMDDPSYLAWKAYRPGTTETLEGPFEDGKGGRFRIRLTFTLVAITANEATVKADQTFLNDADGTVLSTQSSTDSISYKTDPQDVKLLETREISALGKTFSCNIFAGSDIIFSCGTGGWQYCMSNNIPGGIVAIDAKDPGDRPFTLKLISFNAK
jgi:hypothetical protein